MCLVALVALLASCGGRRADSGDAAPSSSSVPGETSTTSTEPSTPVESGTTNGSLDHDGMTRTYRLHVPPGLSSDDSVPLLVALHGGGGSGGQYASASGWDAVADAEGVVVVYPDGTGRIPTWNAGECCGAAARDDVDDVGFIVDLIDELSSTLPVDPDQVVVTGHSNGATMSYRLVCEVSDRIVAIGVQSAPLTDDGCSPSEPVSLLHVHGAADANVPLDGGVGTEGISGLDWPPVREGVDLVAAADGCDPDPDTVSDDATTTTTWSGCADGSEVELVVVAEGVHGWMRPGGSGARGASVDVGGFDTTATIWDFLSRQLD